MLIPPSRALGLSLTFSRAFKNGIFTAETPDQEKKQANQHNNAEEIGQQAENVTDDVVFQEMETRNQSFRQIDDVDQAIENKAIGYTIMKERDDRRRLMMLPWLNKVRIATQSRCARLSK